MRKNKGFFYSAVLFLLLAAAACTCGPLQQAQDTAGTAAAAATSINEALPSVQAAATQFGPTVEAALTQAPTFEAQMTAMIQTADAAGFDPAAIAQTATAIAGGGQSGGSANGQWAASATASSQYGTDSWSAMQASGAPNTTECGDRVTAWASASASEVATLTLTYSTAVVPTQINIYETYNPDAVSLVEVIDGNGTATTVYSAIPSQRTEGSFTCPYILTIDVSGVSSPINQVRITVDQSNFTSWNEIDAVELVGTP